MTESEWWASTDVEKMLAFVQGKASDRKLRLFACACSRRVWHSLPDERCREAVDIFERFVDGQATADDFARADRLANAATDDAAEASSEADADDGDDPDSAVNYHVAEERWAAAYGLCYFAEEDSRVNHSASCAAKAAGFEAQAAFYREYGKDHRAASDAGAAAQESEQVAQSDLLRDVIGNLFRPVRLGPWITPTVTDLATAAYEDRALPTGTLEPVRLAVLADALEESGCGDADMLNHLREPGVHVRGCWVIDLLIGKE